VGLLGTLHRKLHRSGGDGELALEGGDAAVAVGSVAVLDVAGEGMREAVPVEVVGVVDDELGDRAEARLDAVEVAGVGGDRDEFDVVVGGELADARVQFADRPSWIQ
jgi:hypothetical protein